MSDPLVILLIVVVAIGLGLFLYMRRAPRPGDVDEAIGLAAVDADRDAQKTDAVEAKEIAGHQWPGGSL